MDASWREVVREGYDRVSWAYRGDWEVPAKYRAWIEALLGRLPAWGAQVVDLGCGCGVPVTRDLAAAGHRVVGVDISAVQVGRARRLVPAARFIEADLAEVSFPAQSFDAAVCLYALIHLPDFEQRRTLEHLGRWLRPGGVLLATVGAEATTSSDPDWLGAGATMWWNHPDLDTTRGWITESGFTIEMDVFVPEGEGGHQLLLATRTEL